MLIIIDVPFCLTSAIVPFAAPFANPSINSHFCTIHPAWSQKRSFLKNGAKYRAVIFEPLGRCFDDAARLRNVRTHQHEPLMLDRIEQVTSFMDGLNLSRRPTASTPSAASIGQSGMSCRYRTDTSLSNECSKVEAAVTASSGMLSHSATTCASWPPPAANTSRIGAAERLRSQHQLVVQNDEWGREQCGRHGRTANIFPPFAVPENPVFGRTAG